MRLASRSCCCAARQPAQGTRFGHHTKRRVKKRGRHLLGGTGAASAVPDWGESVAPQVTTRAGHIPVYASPETLQHVRVPPELAADRPFHAFGGISRGNPAKLRRNFTTPCPKKYQKCPPVTCSTHSIHSVQREARTQAHGRLLGARLPPPGAHSLSHDIWPRPRRVMSDWATTLPI